MQKSKNVQMPFSFFMELYVFIFRLEDYELDSNIAAHRKSLEYQIKAKLDAMIRRDTFTKYKVAAPGSEEREKFRRQYLELAGIHKDWVSNIETFH